MGGGVNSEELLTGGRIDLSKYRLETAKDELDNAKYLFKGGRFKKSTHCSYYAIYHGLRAVLALDGFESKKHSGNIAYFNQHYVKTGKFAPEISSIVRNASNIRGDADYEDFYAVSAEDAEEQIRGAEEVLHQIESYLIPIYEKGAAAV